MIASHIHTLWRLLLECRNPWVYFFNRLKLAKKGVTYKMWNGFQIRCREYSIDGSALNEVWLDRCYDPNAYGIPFDWKSAKHIADIGGHIGTFTLFAAAHARNAKIVTLEPEPSNFVMVTTNVATNKLLDRVTLHNVGLGDGQPITLYTFPNDRGGNSVYRNKEGGIPVTIQTISLKDIFEKHGIDTLDYAKIDCEGAEYAALYTLPDQYLKRIRCIGMEYHHFSSDPTHNGDALQKFLESKGFRVIRHRKSMMFAVR